MRYAVLSDVHANLEALTAVLAAIDGARVDEIVCLGDVVGYHASPRECIRLLRRRGAVVIAGNHDRVAAGVEEPAGFNLAGRRAILWTRGVLSPEEREYLAGRPLSQVVEGRFLAFHAALHPTLSTSLHLSTPALVDATMRAFVDGNYGVRLGFYGHTHRPSVHMLRGGRLVERRHPVVYLVDDAFYLVNPGSVGQARDGDGRASFVIYDACAAKLTFRHVGYDIDACHAKAAALGLISRTGLCRRSTERLANWGERARQLARHFL